MLVFMGFLCKVEAFGCRLVARERNTRTVLKERENKSSMCGSKELDETVESRERMTEGGKCAQENT